MSASKPNHVSKLLRVCAALLFCLSAFLPQGGVVVQAQTATPPAAQNGESFVISLRAPETLPQGDIPMRADEKQAREAAWGIIQENAKQLIRDLKSLQTQGKIEDFSMKPEQFAIEVRGSAVDLARELGQSDAINQIYPAGREAPACVAKTNQSLIHKIQVISRTSPAIFQAAAAYAAPVEGQDALAANPYEPKGAIEVYPTDTIRGKLPVAKAQVTLSITRKGSPVGKDTTTTDSGGFYYFYPYTSCVSDATDWTVQPGDVVTVTAAGTVYTYTVLNLSAWLDPTPNTIAGKTDYAAGRWMDIVLSAQMASPCTYTASTFKAALDGAGNFASQLSDFNRNSYAMVHVREANLNSTFMYADAFQMRTYDSSMEYVNINYKPRQTVSISVIRSGALLEKKDLNTDYSGYGYVKLSNMLQAGDLVAMTQGTATIDQTTIPAHTAQMSPAANTITGTATPGRLMQAHVYHNGDTYNTTSCTSSSTCASAIAAASGAYSITTSWDIVPGDYANLTVFDGEGNYQQSDYLFAPTLITDLTGGYAEGVWSSAYTSLNIEVYDGTNALLASTTTSTSYYGTFSRYLGVTLAPGYVIKVSDGVNQHTATVQAFTSRLQSGTTAVKGTAPAGTLIAKVWDFQRDNGYWWSYCSESAVGGAFSAALNIPTPLAGQDDGVISLRDGADNYWYRYNEVFSINVNLNGTYIDGYAETPSAQATIQHSRNGALLSSKNATASNYGYFYTDSDTPVLSGDIITVSSSDGSIGQFVVDTITAALDTANNRLYGKAPANNPIKARIERHYGGSYDNYWYIWFNPKANNTGDYSISLNSLYWGKNCTPVSAGDACALPQATYYTPASHAIRLSFNNPLPIKADSFESDDDFAHAQPLTGIQTHTFHTTTDADWVKFTVPAANLNKIYAFRVTPLGWDMRVTANLYDSSQTPLTGMVFQYGPQYIMRYQFTKAGDYYLHLAPYSGSYDAGGCDSAYTLKVSADMLTFLPSLGR